MVKGNSESTPELMSANRAMTPAIWAPTYKDEVGFGAIQITGNKNAAAAFSSLIFAACVAVHLLKRGGRAGGQVRKDTGVHRKNASEGEGGCVGGVWSAILTLGIQDRRA